MPAHLMSMLVLRVCGWMRVMNTGRPPSSRRTTGRVTVSPCGSLPCGILTVSQLRQNKCRDKRPSEQASSSKIAETPQASLTKVVPWFIELRWHVGRPLHLHPARCVHLEKVEHVKVLLQELLHSDSSFVAWVVGQAGESGCRMGGGVKKQGQLMLAATAAGLKGDGTDLLVLHAFELGLQLLLHH